MAELYSNCAQDDGHANSMGMQLLEYMKNPGTGWKSQEEQLQADFIGCYETPFQLPEGEDMPALVSLLFR